MKHSEVERNMLTLLRDSIRAGCRTLNQCVEHLSMKSQKSAFADCYQY